MMKRLLFIAFMCFVSICCLAQQKHALVVAIADYPTESGWSKINSDNDVSILVPEFKRLGFRLSTLVNKEATKQGILHALKQLTKQAHCNDFVCIHFSCHGQQMEDDNQDEPEGLDEAHRVCTAGGLHLQRNIG